MINQRPDLAKVAIPQVGVMDMLRFHKFTIGFNWIADYGSSDNPEEFKALYAYSPLHNIKAGVKYPATLITTADHDDRVVPAHSFKYAATLQEKASKDTPILIRIDTKSGHGASSLTKALETTADIYAFIMHNMGLKPEIPRDRPPRRERRGDGPPPRRRRCGCRRRERRGPARRVTGGQNEKLALVTVVADESRPATALTPADFAITEEKDKLQVVEAVPARDPLSVVRARRHGAAGRRRRVDA